MITESDKHVCMYHVLDGLRDGLCRFSGKSRAALIFSEMPQDDIRIYDPQGLLRGHEPRLEEIYLASEEWRTTAPRSLEFALQGQMYPEKNLELTGLISYGGRTRTMFYQMWFTEHHPDMCCIGPTERWLEQAAFLLSHDLTHQSALIAGTSQYVLREYATHAVRDYILDEMNLMLGWDAKVLVYPILDAILGISRTLEEGFRPRGNLVFVDRDSLEKIDFIVRFPRHSRPVIRNFKHVRKLLQAVESGDRKLVSDGETIVGIATGALPECRITPDFRENHGILRLAGNPVCSFFDGSFHSTNRKPNLVDLEEALIEAALPTAVSDALFRIAGAVVRTAVEKKYGCTLVLDLQEPVQDIAGHRFEDPLDLTTDGILSLAASMAKIDGALHIGADLRLHAFGCLLDGRSLPGENMARGARYNSALRFTARQERLIVVVVSKDKPVSIIQGGVELNAEVEWPAIYGRDTPPPKLEHWLRN